MSHFKQLFEHTIERFNFGGVQIHDYVKIISDKVDGAPVAYSDELKKFIDSDLNIKVLDITTNTYTTNRQTPDKFSVVIGLETASGIFIDKITVPSNILEVVGYNVPPSIPDSWKYKSKADNDGEPVPTVHNFIGETGEDRTFDDSKTKKKSEKGIKGKFKSKKD